MLKRIALGCLLVVSPLAMAAGKTMFVTRDNTKVLADKNSKAATVVILKTGDSLTVEDQGGNFLFKKVTLADGKSGFVAYTALSEKSDSSWKKVSTYVKGFTKPDDNEVESAKARSANAVMGIRGLTSTESEALGSVSNARPDLKSVFAMEERTVNEKKLATLAESIVSENEAALKQAP